MGYLKRYGRAARIRGLETIFQPIKFDTALTPLSMDRK
jgi:hypothetical protein